MWVSGKTHFLLISFLFFKKPITIAQVLQRKLCKFLAYNPPKEVFTFLVFLNYTSGYLKFCKHY